MSSLRHTDRATADPRLDGYLDAARDCILDVGWRRTTLTEVAKRAGVSRMTIYRAWPDMGSLLGDLMTREWVGIAAATRVAAADTTTPAGIAAAALATIRALRDNELFVRIVELDPDLMLPYLLSTVADARRRRWSRSSPPRSRAARSTGAIRAGDPVLMARSLTLAGHGLRLLGADDDRRRVGLRRPRRGVRPPRHPRAGALMEPARRIIPGLDGVPDEVDVVVVGLGITGAGVALDAVTRGLTVLAVDAHDLAFGTSRWSSKLVHGGLRYLAQGQLAIAHESAVERGILMEVTAPHLVHPLPMLTPVNDAMPRRRTAADVGRAAGRRRAAAHRPHHHEDAPAPPPAQRHRDPRPRPRPARRHAPRRAARLGRAARGRRPARRHRRPHRGVVRRRRPHARPRHRRDRHRRRAARRAHRRRRTPSAPGRSSTRPASGPATSTTRCGCGPAAAPTSCCAGRRCRTPGSR